MKSYLSGTISLLAVLVFSGGGAIETAAAMDLNPAEIRGKSRRKPVSVLQNRYFTKTLRPEIGFSAGSLLNEAYTNTSTMGFRGSLFVSEWLGFEYQNSTMSVEDSDDRKALNGLEYYPTTGEQVVVSPDPEVNPVSGVIDYNVILAPFYGKLNLMNQMILYSDLYFTAGMATVDTSQGDLNAMVVGAGQRFYFLKSFSFRIDFRDRIYTEKRLGRDTTKHAYSVDFGMSYFFL